MDTDTADTRRPKREPLVPLPLPANSRVRYSRDWHGNPRDTLVTIEENGKIFFGISRCNPADRIFKKLGRNMAIERALKVKQDLEGTVSFRPAFHLNDDGLTGQCDVRCIKLLLVFFQDIGSLGHLGHH